MSKERHPTLCWAILHYRVLQLKRHWWNWEIYSTTGHQILQEASAALQDFRGGMWQFPGMLPVSPWGSALGHPELSGNVLSTIRLNHCCSKGNKQFMDWGNLAHHTQDKVAALSQSQLLAQLLTGWDFCVWIIFVHAKCKETQLNPAKFSNFYLCQAAWHRCALCQEKMELCFPSTRKFAQSVKVFFFQVFQNPALHSTRMVCGRNCRPGRTTSLPGISTVGLNKHISYNFM